MHGFISCFFLHRKEGDGDSTKQASGDSSTRWPLFAFLPLPKSALPSFDICCGHPPFKLQCLSLLLLPLRPNVESKEAASNLSDSWPCLQRIN